MDYEEIRAIKQDIISSLHCALPGTLVSFDAEAQTAVIQPAVGRRQQRPNVGEGFLVPPLLRDVPVFMPVSFEVHEGDHCLVVFADCDIDTWVESGEVSVPASNRMHSLSDGFAFIGFDSDGGQIGGGDDPDLSNYYTKAETDLLLDGKKGVQSAVSDPVADGTGISFIDSISQDAGGIISPHKQTVREASSSQSGLMSAADKEKLDGITIPEIWPVSRGGSGQSGTVTENDVAEIIDIGQNYTVRSANYAQWGKLAMLELNLTANAAVTGYNSVGRVAEGKRPVINCTGHCKFNSGDTRFASLTYGGYITFPAPVEQSALMSLYFVYLLA